MKENKNPTHLSR